MGRLQECEAEKPCTIHSPPISEKFSPLKGIIKEKLKDPKFAKEYNKEMERLASPTSWRAEIYAQSYKNGCIDTRQAIAEDVVRYIDDYFNGLIAIPAPEITKEKLKGFIKQRIIDAS